MPSGFYNFFIPCLFCWAVVTVLLVIYGNTSSFLMINEIHFPSTDIFFRYITHLGDGLFYGAVIFIFLFISKRWFLHLIAAFLCTSLVSRIGKDIIFTDMLRPKKYFELSDIIIRTIDGLRINEYHSFPSGHTATAFSMFLILSIYFNKRLTSIFFLIIVALVGFSRVYLAQHFPLDVLAGSIIGVIVSMGTFVMIESYLKKGKINQPDQPMINL